jgi:hypothetical protein
MKSPYRPVTRVTRAIMPMERFCYGKVRVNLLVLWPQMSPLYQPRMEVQRMDRSAGEMVKWQFEVKTEDTCKTPARESAPQILRRIPRK